MASETNIFSKLRLQPGQLRAVAERRFADAQCLLDSGNVERTNGAIYMAGFVVECLLKAMLLERHPNLAKPVDPATLSVSDREVLTLLYSHNLDEMLEFLPEVQLKLKDIRTSAGLLAWNALRDICEEWTVYARYSSKLAKMEHGKRYVGTIGEVKKWLKDL